MCFATNTCFAFAYSNISPYFFLKVLLFYETPASTHSLLTLVQFLLREAMSGNQVSLVFPLNAPSLNPGQVSNPYCSILSIYKFFKTPAMHLVVFIDTNTVSKHCMVHVLFH